MRWVRFGKENTPQEGEYIHTHAPHSPIPLSEMQPPEMHGNHIQHEGETATAVAH